jgi:hypothetical protein
MRNVSSNFSRQCLQARQAAAVTRIAISLIKTISAYKLGGQLRPHTSHHPGISGISSSEAVGAFAGLRHTPEVRGSRPRGARGRATASCAALATCGRAPPRCACEDRDPPLLRKARSYSGRVRALGKPLQALHVAKEAKQSCPVCVRGDALNCAALAHDAPLISDDRHAESSR